MPTGTRVGMRADTVLQVNSREVPAKVMAQLSQDKGTQGQGTGDRHSHRMSNHEPRLELRQEAERKLLR